MPEDRHGESVWTRAKRDTASAAHSLTFILATGALDAVVATVAVWALPNDPTTTQQVTAGVGGALLGTLVAVGGAFAVQLWLAPVRQRDEARAERKPSEGDARDDPSGFARGFSAWLDAKRAALPDWPGGELRYLGGLRSDSPVLHRYKQTYAEAERQARVEYHERFRATVVALLGDVHTDETRNPRTLKDLGVVEDLLLRRVGGFGQPTPDAVRQLRQRLNEAHELEARGDLDGSGLPPVEIANDRLYAWAHATWQLLKSDFTEYAREFYGSYPQIGSGYFHTAFRLETSQLGRDAYLDRRTKLVERVLREKT